MNREPQLVVFHRPGPKWRKGTSLFDQDGVMDHVAHYRNMLEAGKLFAGGPFLDAEGGGMMIAAKGVDRAELEAFAARDPTVASGLLTFEIRPWLIGMAGGA
jgi:uncharacterized protein YciI